MMIQAISADVAIIGAGVVGLAIAERLLDEGRKVVLIDPNDAGMGASYGNAGTIADYAVMPVGTPDVLKSLPSLLFNRNSPLSIRRAALPALAPWLMRFAAQSLPWAARRNAASIAALLADATSAWQGLAERIGGTDILQHRGCLYAYETPRAFRAAERDMAQRRALGVTVELISAQALAAMEPAMAGVVGGAAYFPNAVFMNDPGAMVQRLAAYVLGQAQLVRARADRIERRFDGVVVHGRHLHVHARKVVIAAGAHSGALARAAGDKLPLDTERGYHVEWDMAEPLLKRPTCPTSRGFYFCPMQGRLRVAGTVELGGLTAPPSPHRIDRLVDGARAFFPELGEPDRTWMGFRPSMPDSVPVIGPSRGGADVIHAFGHGHVGLTAAPATARIVADLVAGREPDRDITPYLATRF